MTEPKFLNFCSFIQQSILACEPAGQRKLLELLLIQVWFSLVSLHTVIPTCKAYRWLQLWVYNRLSWWGNSWILNSEISGFHILHSWADLPVTWRIPPCLCLSCSQGKAGIWLPSPSPHELIFGQSTLQSWEWNPLPGREWPILSIESFTTVTN